jgi:hypothetical protein
VALTPSIFGQSQDAPLPEEAAGFENIVPALMAVFDRADVLTLGEDHLRKIDSDLWIALVRHPDFPQKVRLIMVEFGSGLHQATLDRYVGGGDVSPEELRQVWATTTTGIWDTPMYADFFAAVRELNAKLPTETRIRVLAGDPGKGVQIQRDDWAVSTLEREALEKGEKALLICGSARFFRPVDRYPLPGGAGGITKLLEENHPGRTFVVVTLGGADPKYQSFERALKSPIRPVLVPLNRLPFRDFAAEDFLGPKLTNPLPGGGLQWVYQDSGVRLGETADAGFYFGTDEDANPRVMPKR